MDSCTGKTKNEMLILKLFFVVLNCMLKPNSMQHFCLSSVNYLHDRKNISKDSRAKFLFIFSKITKSSIVLEFSATLALE